MFFFKQLSQHLIWERIGKEITLTDSLVASTWIIAQEVVGCVRMIDAFQLEEISTQNGPPKET